MGTKHEKGFTLMELMVVLAIVAILAAVAIPAYTEHMNKTRRSDAQAALLDVSQRLERCYSMYNRYDHADCPVSLPQASPEGFYAISGTVNANDFALTATPPADSPQQGDDDCTTLTVDHLNRKGATGANTSKCW